MPEFVGESAFMPRFNRNRAASQTRSLRDVQIRTGEAELAESTATRRRASNIDRALRNSARPAPASEATTARPAPGATAADPTPQIASADTAGVKVTPRSPAPTATPSAAPGLRTSSFARTAAGNLAGVEGGGRLATEFSLKALAAEQDIAEKMFQIAVENPDAAMAFAQQNGVQLPPQFEALIRNRQIATWLKNMMGQLKQQYPDVINAPKLSQALKAMLQGLGQQLQQQQGAGVPDFVAQGRSPPGLDLPQPSVPPITLSQGQRAVHPGTGATVASVPPRPERPVTLSPGQSAFPAAGGDAIGSVPAAPRPPITLSAGQSAFPAGGGDAIASVDARPKFHNVPRDSIALDPFGDVAGANLPDPTPKFRPINTQDAAGNPTVGSFNENEGTSTVGTVRGTVGRGNAGQQPSEVRTAIWLAAKRAEADGRPVTAGDERDAMEFIRQAKLDPSKQGALAVRIYDSMKRDFKDQRSDADKRAAAEAWARSLISGQDSSPTPAPSPASTPAVGAPEARPSRFEVGGQANLMRRARNAQGVEIYSEDGGQNWFDAAGNIVQ